MNPGSTDQINSCDGEIHHVMVLINQASTVLLLLSHYYINVATPSKTPNQHGPSFEPVYISPNGPKKIHKVLQLSGMSRSMSELKKKPLTRSIRLFFLREIVQYNQKTAFSTVFGHFLLK
jgi:hypothetical protein